jgi:hypothetical protein
MITNIHSIVTSPEAQNVTEQIENSRAVTEELAKSGIYEDIKNFDVDVFRAIRYEQFDESFFGEINNSIQKEVKVEVEVVNGNYITRENITPEALEANAYEKQNDITTEVYKILLQDNILDVGSFKQYLTYCNELIDDPDNDKLKRYKNENTEILGFLENYPLEGKTPSSVIYAKALSDVANDGADIDVEKTTEKLTNTINDDIAKMGADSENTLNEIKNTLNDCAERTTGNEYVRDAFEHIKEALYEKEKASSFDFDT